MDADCQENFQFHNFLKLFCKANIILNVKNWILHKTSVSEQLVNH